MFGMGKKKKVAVPDVHDDYAYGNNIAAYGAGTRPYFSFIHGDQIPTPGAMAYSNESQRLVMRPFIGSAVGQSLQFRILNNVFPLHKKHGYAVQTGLGGLASGQIALQPLSDPYNGEA
jgi:hypothetical protein